MAAIPFNQLTTNPIDGTGFTIRLNFGAIETGDPVTPPPPPVVSVNTTRAGIRNTVRLE